MTDDEAIAICEGWFEHLRWQRDKARTMSELATLARNGQQEEARRRMSQIDRQPKVYDGAHLLPAVRHLVKRVRDGNTEKHS